MYRCQAYGGASGVSLQAGLMGSAQCASETAVTGA